MNKESFWIFGHLGLGDMIVSNALYRHYSNLNKDKFVILPIWEHNLAAVQWMLSDVPNIFFYPIETEQQLLTCKESVSVMNKLCLGFYAESKMEWFDKTSGWIERKPEFNPVKWDSEFYRQAGLDPELKWTGFKLPDIFEGNETWKKANKEQKESFRKASFTICVHEDEERGFKIKHELIPDRASYTPLEKSKSLSASVFRLMFATEIHCIDSSMLNLADLMETPHCKRFVFHRYARKGLPPTLKKNWEVIE